MFQLCREIEWCGVWGYISTGMATVFLRASRHCPTGLLLGISWIVPWGGHVPFCVCSQSMCDSLSLVNLGLLLVSPWEGLVVPDNCSLISVAVVNYPDKMQLCFNLQFEVTVLHCGELKTGTSNSQSYHIHWQEQRAMDVYMIACSCLAPFLYSLLSSRPLTQGIVPPLEMIHQYSLLIGQWYSVTCIFHISFIPSLVGKHLGSFQFV